MTQDPFPLDRVRFNDQGLAPVIAQDALTGVVLMQAWANREALERTLASGHMHYWSRSRAKLWRKGEESGHVQEAVRLALDCDQDAVLALVRQTGPACHTGRATCWAVGDGTPLAPTLADLARVIASRQGASPDDSYTARLLADPTLARAKITEEAGELVQALERESDRRVAEEAADLVYHALAAAAARGVGLDAILAVLAARRR